MHISGSETYALNDNSFCDVFFFFFKSQNKPTIGYERVQSEFPLFTSQNKDTTD